MGSLNLFIQRINYYYDYFFVVVVELNYIQLNATLQCMIANGNISSLVNDDAFTRAPHHSNHPSLRETRNLPSPRASDCQSSEPLHYYIIINRTFIVLARVMWRGRYTRFGEQNFNRFIYRIGWDKVKRCCTATGTSRTKIAIISSDVLRAISKKVHDRIEHATKEGSKNASIRSNMIVFITWLTDRHV